MNKEALKGLFVFSSGKMERRVTDLFLHLSVNLLGLYPNI